MQESGSLYGAVLGSVLAFSVADALGCLLTLSKVTCVLILCISEWFLYKDSESNRVDLLEGRRRELIAASLFYFLGSVLMAFAPSFAVLLAGRLAYGFGIGMVSVLIGQYQFLWCSTCLAVKYYFGTPWLKRSLTYLKDLTDMAQQCQLD